jgi:hypothetical protein
MYVKLKWRFLLLSPLVIVPSLYLFLLCANYYYATRAAYILQRIRTMKVDNSSIAELKRLGSEHGLRYLEAGAEACASGECIYQVSPNNRWMWPLLRPPVVARVGRTLGLRAWVAVGDIVLQNHEVTGKIYGLGFFDGEVNPVIEVSAWDERRIDVDVCTYYPLKRHPGYAFTNASNVRSFRVLVASDATVENHDRAYQFNLSCLRGWHQCKDFSEIVPAAWADYEEDGKWSETHPNTLVRQLGAPCTYR